MSDPDPAIQNPIEDQVEAAHTSMRTKNREYKATIGQSRDRDSEVAAARQRLNETETAEAGAKETEDKAKGELVAAIDTQMQLLAQARGLLVPPGQ